MGCSATRVLKAKARWSSFAGGCVAQAAWAVRPLAASAPLAAFEALEGCAGSRASSSLRASRLGAGVLTSFSKASQGHSLLSAGFGRGRVRSSGSLVQGSLPFKQSIPASSRLRARQGTEGRASTRCCAARAGGVRLLASGATQRKMQAVSGRASRVRPNPSMERTRPGKPGRASHVKR